MCTIICRRPRPTRFGFGIITLVSAELAAANIYNAKSYGSVIDTAINSLLCAAIGASSLVKVSHSPLHGIPTDFAYFETLNEVLELSSVLLPYVSRCIVFIRAFILKPDKWNVLDLTENSLYTKTLSPIREMFERCSPSEFLKHLPLLSRRFMREGALDTDFSIYEEITKCPSQTADKEIVQLWFHRSCEIHEYCAQLLDRNVTYGKEYFQHCKKVLRDDAIDILSVYPNLLLVLTELAEVTAF